MMDTPASLLARAQAGDSAAAADLWRAIAAGQVDDAIAAAWARDVAGQVVAKVLNPNLPANRRAEKARAALGLEGRVDLQAELKRLALEIAPDATAAELAELADLVVDLGTADRVQLRRKIDYIRQKARKG